MDMPLRVVIVEDNLDLAVLLQEQLQLAGCEVTTCTEKFSDIEFPEYWQNVDAVVVDMWLTPQGFNTGFPHGFRLLEYLIENFPEIVRVVYSAVPAEFIHHEGKNVREYAHFAFTKPMRTDELIEALRG